MEFAFVMLDDEQLLQLNIPYMMCSYFTALNESKVDFFYTCYAQILLSPTGRRVQNKNVKLSILL